MPSVSELVVLAIAILSIVAFALLLAPSFVWIRRRFSDSAGQAREATAEGMAESKGGSAETSRALVVTTDDEVPALPLTPDAPQVKPVRIDISP